MRHTLTALGFAAILGGMLSGCTTSGVGDPCEPERVPEGGFDRAEVFLETNSVQCRTRVCMVYKLDGNPRHVEGEDSCPCLDGTPTANNPTCERLFDDCVTAEQLEQRVQCSCRCALLPGATSSLPLCSCPGGYQCTEARTTGGDGLEGSYCVPDSVAPTAP